MKGKQPLYQMCHVHNYVTFNMPKEQIKLIHQGLWWWWSSGQHAYLQFRRSEFESAETTVFSVQFVFENNENKQKRGRRCPI